MPKQLEAEMADVGLVVKSAPPLELRLSAEAVDSESHALMKLQEKEIKVLSITDTYKYLGVQIGPHMKYASLADRVQKGLHSISRLKPCQRLYILKHICCQVWFITSLSKNCSRIP